jgi:hypothetical protein
VEIGTKTHILKGAKNVKESYVGHFGGGFTGRS